MNKIYSVKEAFYTLQGEGFHTGRPAVFLRFSGCNLWSGREQHRDEAVCKFCDTDFVGTDGRGGGKFESPQELAEHVDQFWPGGPNKYVVCTGGEPLLQLDTPLIEAFHDKGIEIAIESNGTIAAPAGIDWICVSPKANAPLVQQTGNELKLVYPQKEKEASPELFEELDFEHLSLQPLQDKNWEENTQTAIRYCLEHPRWRLSLQTHKYLGIP